MTGIENVDGLDDELLDLVLEWCDGLTLPLAFLVNSKWRRVACGQRERRDARRMDVSERANSAARDARQSLHLLDADEIREDWCRRHRCALAYCRTERYMQRLLDADYIDLAKWAHEKTEMPLAVHNMYAAAARCGDAETIEWLWQRGHRPGWSQTFDEALEHGYTDLFWHLVDLFCMIAGKRETEDGLKVVVHSVAHYGTSDMLDRVAQRGGKPCVWSLIYAAQANNQDTLQWIYGRLVASSEVVQFTGLYGGAALNGNMAMLEWVHDRRCEYEHEHESRLSSASQKRLVVWNNWSQVTASDAARKGHLAVLEWLHARGYAIGTRAYLAAAQHGWLHILQWLHAHERADKPDVYKMALAGNHRHVMQWAYDVGIPWNDDLCRSAAAHDQLETLQWLRARGCPWDKDVLGMAIRNCCIDLFDWAWDNGCPRPDDTATLCVDAVDRGYLKALRHVRHVKGVEWDARTCEAAARLGHLAVVKWAHSEGCPWNEGVCASAAREGRLDILVWARRHGCPWDWSATLREARDAKDIARRYNMGGDAGPRFDRLIEWIQSQAPTPADADPIPDSFFYP